MGRCAEIGLAVCEALETAHAKDIIHRDIKPGNILIDARGRAKVADFGIARLTGSEGASLGTQIGTPAYMAPEQTRGKAVRVERPLQPLLRALRGRLRAPPLRRGGRHARRDAPHHEPGAGPVRPGAGPPRPPAT